jgi:hypothetical protein
MGGGGGGAIDRAKATSIPTLLAGPRPCVRADSGSGDGSLKGFVAPDDAAIEYRSEETSTVDTGARSSPVTPRVEQESGSEQQAWKKTKTTLSSDPDFCREGTRLTM